MSLEKLIEYGCVPYIATSAHLLPHFNLEPFGYRVTPFIDGPEYVNFHHAYVRSNTVAFEADLNMPEWVYIDYVLLQTAAVGFMVERSKASHSLLSQFDSDPLVDLEKLEYIPISGQTAGLTADGETWLGCSLFSLAKHFPELRSLGLATFTRGLALKCYGAKKFRGITQYDNPAVGIHGKTTKAMKIIQPIVWLHPRTHMTFLYEQELDYDINALSTPDPEEYDFLLSAYDLEKKKEIEQGLAAGKQYRIVSPFRIVDGENVFLPIQEIS